MTAPGVDLLLDGVAIDAASDGLARRYLAAGTRTIGAVTRRAEQRLEALTQRAAGGRLWRAWQSSVFPRGGGPARDPVGEIWVKGRARTDGALKFWTEPGRIQSRSGGWLPVPLPVAGRRNRAGILSPREWELSHPDWKLDLLWQEGKRPVLVAHRRKARSINSLGGRYALGRAGPVRGGGGFVEGQPIFALVRDNPFRNAVAIAPVIQQAKAEMPGEYAEQARKVQTGRRA